MDSVRIIGISLRLIISGIRPAGATMDIFEPGSIPRRSTSLAFGLFAYCNPAMSNCSPRHKKLLNASPGQWLILNSGSLQPFPIHGCESLTQMDGGVNWLRVMVAKEPIEMLRIDPDSPTQKIAFSGVDAASSKGAK